MTSPTPLPPVAHKSQPARPRVLVQSIPGHEDASTGPAMFELDGCLTVQEAQEWVDAAEARGFSQQGSGGAAAGEAYRDNGRLLVRDPSTARMLWERTGLREVFRRGGSDKNSIRVDGAEPLGLSANLRLYRYCGGGRERFGRHVDGCDEDAEVELESGEVVRGVTGYTLLFYLSGGGKEEAPTVAAAAATAAGGGKQPATAASSSSSSSRVVFPRASQRLQGGETKFYSSGGDGRRAGTLVVAVAPMAGKALLHLHGYDRCLEHEAAAVASGTKYVLRSDVVFDRPVVVAAGAANGGKAAPAARGKAGAGAKASSSSSGRRR